MHGTLLAENTASFRLPIWKVCSLCTAHEGHYLSLLFTIIVCFIDQNNVGTQRGENVFSGWSECLEKIITALSSDDEVNHTKFLKPDYYSKYNTLTFFQLSSSLINENLHVPFRIITLYQGFLRKMLGTGMDLEGSEKFHSIDCSIRSGISLDNFFWF